VEEHLESRKAGADLPEVSIWKRFLEPKEREKLDLAIAEVVPTLSERERTAWAKFHEEGKTEPEIAQELGIVPAYVYDLLNSARDRIEERFLGHSSDFYLAVRAPVEGESEKIKRIR